MISRHHNRTVSNSTNDDRDLDGLRETIERVYYIGDHKYGKRIVSGGATETIKYIVSRKATQH